MPYNFIDMPTVRQNIAYLSQDFMLKHRASFWHVMRCLALIVVIALFLEVFVFNMNYYLSAGYNTIKLDNKVDLQKNEDDQFLVTSVDNTLEFSNLNTEIHNIQLDFDFEQPAQVVTVRVHFTDEAHSTYFDTTEYTIGTPDKEVSTYVGRSEYLDLETSGLVDKLSIEIIGDDVNYPVILDSVVLNAHYPFEFNGTRFLIVLGVLFLIFVFRPGSSIYRISIVGNPRTSRAIIVVATAVEILLVSAYLFLGSNLVGVATKDYNSGSWDETSLINTFEVGGDNAQQYAELAKAFTEGNLYLDEDPPQWLQDLDDPYDKGARDEAVKAGGEDYLFDVAYYDGHYYVYFGVVPVLLFYLPFYLLTGANFPTAIGVLIAAIAFIIGCSALLDRFARHHFKRVSLGLLLLVQAPLVFCCGMLYLTKFPTFYSLPIAVGLAFSVWGLYLWMVGRDSKRPEGWYIAGSLCMALVAGCRPQLLVLSLLAFPLFWRRYITERRLFTPRGVREFACLFAPYIVVGAGIMLYNYARFGSCTNFGANYNLTLNDMTMRGFNVGRLAPALFAYFIQPPEVTGVFPFVQATTFDTTYLGQTIKEATYGGILLCLPVLWVLPFVKRILTLRVADRSTHTIVGVVVVLLVGGLIVAIADAEMAGILQRYYADFSFMFLAAAVLLIFVANEHLQPGTTKNLLLKVLIVAVTVSVLYSVLVCFVPETGWFSDVYDWAYQNIIVSVQFWN